MNSIVIVVLSLLALAYAQIYSLPDGTNNGNRLGQHEVQLPRLAPNAYDDGVSEPRGGGFNTMATLPSARLVSNNVASGSGVSARPISDWHTFWGQFLDHDITLVEENAMESFDIVVPMGDPVFPPGSSMPLIRSESQMVSGVREQFNLLTSYIDASNVYGADNARAAALRENVGGRLLSSDDGRLPPLNNIAAVPMGSIGITGATLYAAGDVRANENSALLAVHTLWVREHNRQAAALAADSNGPCDSDDDECLYNEARRRVMALHQVIFEQEYSPPLFPSNGGLSTYNGYNSSVSSAVSNEFSILFRYGHSELNNMIMRDDIAGRTYDALSLNQVFFNPMVNDGTDIDALLSGMSRQQQQEIDVHNVDAIRNTLFMLAEPANSQAQDLVARNLQRARDHGIPSLNGVRTALGLSAYTDFTWCDDQTDCDNLMNTYASINDVDVWIGALAEPHVSGGGLGETMDMVIANQYSNFRDGDEYWYSNPTNPAPFTSDEIAELRATSLTDVIFRNALDIQELPCSIMEFGGMTCMNPNNNDSGAATTVVSLATIAAIAAFLF